MAIIRRPNGEPLTRFHKKCLSYNSIIPSENMTADVFQAWLECASLDELDNDIVKLETLYKMRNYTRTHWS